MVVLLQPLDQDHLCVVRPGLESIQSSVLGPPDSASLRHAPINTGSTPAPTLRDPHLDALVPIG
jgi:hypothetical protein